MNYQFFDIEIRDGVAVVELMEPGASSVTEIQEELLDLLLRLQEDRDVRVILFGDSGSPLAFGHSPEHLSEVRTSDEGPELIRAELDTIQRIVTLMHESAKPFVAAVSGETVGHGFGLLMNADIKLAAPSATFRVNDPRTGLVSGWGLCSSLPRSCGQSAALEILWSGRTIGSVEAHRKGIIDRIIPDETWLEDVESFCRQLASIPQPSLHLGKLAVQQSGQLDQTAMLDLELEVQLECWDSEETRSGLSALADGLDPDFPSPETR